MRVEVPWLIYHSHPTEGHAFLEGSLTPDALEPGVRVKIENFADRSPRYGDGRSSWEPYPSGLPVGNNYAVAWTRQAAPGSRPGSIVTQVLLFPRSVLANSDDLGSALRAAQAPLSGTGPKMVDLSTEPIQVGDAGYMVITALIRAAGQPVAVIGESHWVAALTETWAALWPEARAGLHFRAFETPHDVVGEPDIILVPDPGGMWTAPAWRGGVVRAPVQGTPQPPILAALRGTLAGNVVGGIRELRRLNVVHAALRDATQGVPQAIRALSVLAHAPLAENVRQDVGAVLTTQILEMLPQQPAAIIAELETVPADLAVPLTPAVTVWFKRALAEAPEEARILAEHAAAPASGTASWLTDALRDGLSQLVPCEVYARLLWAWWTQETLLDLILPALGPRWDSPLASTVPSDVAATALRSVALGHSWPRLYGVLTARDGVLDALLDTPAAMRADVLAGARLKLEPATFLGWAVAYCDEDVMNAAADSLVTDPSVLQGATLTDGAWLQVWTRALTQLSRPDPGGRRSDVLQLVLHGVEVPHGLLQALARDGGGDLLAHPNRDELLDQLPAEYLEQTADAYLRSNSDPGEANDVLLSVVRSRLRQVNPTPQAARRLWQSAGLTDGERRQVERQAAQVLTVHDEAWIERQPLSARRRLLDHAPRAVQWTLRRLLPSLAIVRLAADLGKEIDHRIWWMALEDAAVDINDPRRLWSRLKAPTKDFPVSGSARDQWHHALAELQRGAGPDTWDVLRLLEEARPHSADIQALRRTCPITQRSAGSAHLG